MGMNVWSLCDRCGQKYYRRQLRKESTNLVVCSSCYDGAYDLKKHPQNRPPRPRYESRRVPDGRAQAFLGNNYLAQENGAFLLLENGGEIIVTQIVWNPSLSSSP
jgi:ribosome-binding protein aMBF1 (putative translation factor)